jgi:hypothetical protein
LAHQPGSDLLGSLVEQCGELMQEVLGPGQRGRGEQPLFVPEEVVDHGDIHAGIDRDRENAGVLISLAHEPFARYHRLTAARVMRSLSGASAHQAHLFRSRYFV